MDIFLMYMELIELKYKTTDRIYLDVRLQTRGVPILAATVLKGPEFTDLSLLRLCAHTRFAKAYFLYGSRGVRVYSSPFKGSSIFCSFEWE